MGKDFQNNDSLTQKSGTARPGWGKRKSFLPQRDGLALLQREEALVLLHDLGQDLVQAVGEDRLMGLGASWADHVRSRSRADIASPQAIQSP